MKNQRSKGNARKGPKGPTVPRLESVNNRGSAAPADSLPAVTGLGRLKNWEVAVYALYLTGGVSKPVHTEEISVKCFELARDAFSWVRFPNFPDKDVARMALTDARKAKAGALVMGRAGRGQRPAPTLQVESASDGWMLTESGAAWVAKNEERLLRLLLEREPRSDRQEVLQRLSRIRAHSLFESFRNSPSSFGPSLGEMADLFRCRPDAPLSIWQKRIQGLRGQARIADQVDTLEFLDRCLARVESSASGATTG